MNTKTFVFKGQPDLRLDHFLANQCPDLSRTIIQKLIRQHKVSVNQLKVKSSYHLQTDDLVTMNWIEQEPEQDTIHPENIPLDIFYEDDALIIVNKPAGMIVHPGTGQKQGTLVHALKYRCQTLSNINGQTRPGIVHRLDQETSGLIIVAKTNFAHRHIAEQFHNRTIQKIYLGFTWGIWNEKKGVIQIPIKRSRKDATSFSVNEKGRMANTVFQVMEEFRLMSVVNFLPKTGRTHQIRVHAAYMNHPLVCDQKYHGGESRTYGFLPEVKRDLLQQMRLLNRHALHASELKFVHPETGKTVEFKSSIPEDMLQFYDHLKKHYA